MICRLKDKSYRKQNMRKYIRFKLKLSDYVFKKSDIQGELGQYEVVMWSKNFHLCVQRMAKLCLRSC
jgi:predicted metal-binding transcription factor (methanogenesis marker protein 9)